VSEFVGRKAEARIADAQDDGLPDAAGHHIVRPPGAVNLTALSMRFDSTAGAVLGRPSTHKRFRMSRPITRGGPRRRWRGPLLRRLRQCGRGGHPLESQRH
jgi:hypothetical protein